jgi:hypothetical protein
MKIIILIAIVISIFITINSVNANGLQINQSVMNLTKISGSDLVYTFNIGIVIDYCIRKLLLCYVLLCFVIKYFLKYVYILLFMMSN